MRFLLDQILSPKTTEFLKSLGLEAYDLRMTGLTGASDVEVYSFARENSLGIVTYNTGFSRMYISRRNLPCLILLRVHPQTIESLHPVLEDFFRSVPLERLSEKLAVIQPYRYRLRNVTAF